MIVKTDTVKARGLNIHDGISIDGEYYCIMHKAYSPVDDKFILSAVNVKDIEEVNACIESQDVEKFDELFNERVLMFIAKADELFDVIRD